MSSGWGFCSCCGKPGPLEHHHMFHQVAWAKKLYGDLLHDERNRQWACSDCHASHRSTKLIHLSEEEFCERLGIEPRSKTARAHGKEK